MEHLAQWHQMVDLVTTAITTKSSLVQHHFDGESKFVFSLLERVMRLPEPLVIKKDGLIFKLEVGRIHIERPLTYDAESNTCQPVYPHQARWTETSYTASVKCDFVFKLLSPPPSESDKDDIYDVPLPFDDIVAPKLGTLSSLPVVEQASAFTINAGEIFVGLRGQLCRIKGSGMLCHEDPDIEGGFHIYKGSEKVTESQFVQRTNHIYVHFLNSSTSTSQSTTASEATNVDSTTADSPIILQCDYRPADDDLMRTYSAFHIYMVVEKPRHARQVMQRQMRHRKWNAEGHFESSSPTEPIVPKNFPFLSSNTPVMGATLGLCEHATILFPNVDEFNLNLVLVLFLLGLDDRASMIRCILPNECDLLTQRRLMNDDGSLKLDDLPTDDPLLHHAIIVYYQVYTMIHNQTLFVASDQVDPRQVYYSRTSDVDETFTSRKGTYEYIVANHTPFIGQDSDDTPTSITSSYSEVPHPSFVQQYHEASLDGWDRSAALAHIARVMLVRGSQKKKAGAAAQDDDNQTESKKPTKYARDYGTLKMTMPHTRVLPEQAESDRLHKALARFAKSFVEELLPNIGTTSEWHVIVAKRTMLGFMIRKMALVFMGYMPPDSQDNLEMKLTESVGQMMARVWSLNWQKGVSKFFRRIIGQVDKARGVHSTAINWQSIAASCFPTSPFTGPMDNGIWPRAGATVMKVKGCTKRLQYANAVTFLKSMRMVHTITNEKGGSRMKDSPAQQVDTTHYQHLCPLDTANDKEAGIDLNFALGTKVRIGYTRTDLLAAIMQGAAQPKTSIYYNHFVRLHDAPSTACAFDHGIYHVPAGSVPIFVNDGNLVGFTWRPFETMRALRLARSNKFIPADVGITWVGGPVGPFGTVLRNVSYNYICVTGEWGATLTPYFDTSQLYKLPAIVMAHSSAQGIFPNFTLAACAARYSGDYHYPAASFNLGHGMLFNALIKEGVIVYRGAEEEAQEMICHSLRDLLPDLDWYRSHSAFQQQDYHSVNWNEPGNLAEHTLRFNPGSRHNTAQGPKRYGLCVISESLQLGVTASVIPFVNSDDTCRASYSTGMTAQSTGPAPLNLAFKKNIYHMYLFEPKRSLSMTRACRQFSILGAANAAVPSLTCFYGHGSNGEDAVLRSIAPWFRYHVNHLISCTSSGKEKSDVQHGGPIETVYQFANPKDYESCLTLKSTDYSCLKEDGTPKIGSLSKPGAALVGRVFAVGSNGSAQRDGSFVNSSRMKLSVASVTKGRKNNGLTSRVVRASALRVQVAGDKTSSEHGQKGAATVKDRASLPYAVDVHRRGIIPHCYRTPAGVPSRTTIAEQRAFISADISIQEGRNNTTHCWEQDRDLFGALEKIGPNMLDCSLVNPETGVPFRTSVSMGVLDFRLMRHLARETFNSRTLGAVDPKTEQPTQGAKKRGGSREGPLEALNKISQGATDVVESLLFTSSDPGFAHLCISCGLLASSAAPQVLLSSARAQSMAAPPSKKNRAKLFANQIANTQGGIFHSADATSPLTPSGGWCNVCKRGDHVYRVPMAKVTRQLMEYGYLSHQSWRIITNAKVVKPLPPVQNTSMQEDIQEELNFADATLTIPLVDDPWMTAAAPPSPEWPSSSYMMAPPSPTYTPL